MKGGETQNSVTNQKTNVPRYQRLGFPGSSAGKESTCHARDLGSIPELGRSPGEGHGNPLQYSGLENSMDGMLRGVTKSRTQVRDFPFHFHYQCLAGGDTEPQSLLPKSRLFKQHLVGSRMGHPSEQGPTASRTRCV